MSYVIYKARFVILELNDNNIIKWDLDLTFL
jgi:hypothetical protein